MYEEVISAFTFSNVPLLVVAGLAFALAYWQYIYSFRLVRREHKDPYPIWMHTFFLAHDSSWAVILLFAAPRYHWHWFLTATPIALFVWTLFEVFCIYKAVTVERQEIWGGYFGDDVTARQAVGNILVQLAVFYGVINLLIVFMGEGCVLQSFALTGVVIAIAPLMPLLRRGSRDGCSIGLAIVTLAGTVLNFLPVGMFVTALPEVFNTPWFYITGVVVSGIAAWNVIAVASMPKKVPLAGQGRPIW